MSLLTSSTIIRKQPSEVLNLAMEFAPWLTSGVTISTATVTCSPSGLIITNEAISGTQVTFTAASGTAGTNYRIEITITTSAGETLTGEGKLQVRDR